MNRNNTMKNIYRIFLGLICFIMIAETAAVFGISAAASYEKEANLDFGSQNIFMICLDNRQVIFEKNSAERARPASLTKIINAMVFLDNCKDLSKKVTVKKEVLDLLEGTKASVAHLQEGEILTLKDCLYYMLLISGGDAALTIADYVSGGDIPKYVDMMNEKAREAGCRDTHFSNPTGLDEDDQYTTCEDMALLAELAFGYKEILEASSSLRYTVPATNLREANTITNSAEIMRSDVEEYYTHLVRAGKTGSTSLSGRCLLTLSEIDGKEFITVALNAPYDKAEDEEYINRAFSDTKNMLEWTDRNLKYSGRLNTGKLLEENGAGNTDLPENIRLLIPDGFKTKDISLKAGAATGKPPEIKVLYSGSEISRVIPSKETGIKKSIYGTVYAMRYILITAVAAVIILIVFLSGKASALQKSEQRGEEIE